MPRFDRIYTERYHYQRDRTTDCTERSKSRDRYTSKNIMIEIAMGSEVPVRIITMTETIIVMKAGTSVTVNVKYFAIADANHVITQQLEVDPSHGDTQQTCRSANGLFRDHKWISIHTDCKTESYFVHFAWISCILFELVKNSGLPMLKTSGKAVQEGTKRKYNQTTTNMSQKITKEILKDFENWMREKNDAI